MSSPASTILSRALPASVLGLVLALPLGAQSSQTSEIEGIMYINASPNSDILISPAFGRTAAWRGAVASATSDTLAVQGSPGWTVNRFAGAEAFYARLRSGALEGQYFTITANDAGSVTLDAAGFDLTQVASGDGVEIVPYWTLAAFYPLDQAGTGFIISTSALRRQTELLFINPAGTGINRSATTVYFYLNGAWRKLGAPVTESYDDTIILPDSYFVQRNKAQATTLAVTGRVFTGLLGTVVEGGSARQDNYLSISFPLDVTLASSGLVGDGVFSPSLAPESRTDELLVFPAGTGFNRVPVAYYYYNSGWRRVGDDPANDHGTVVLPAGGGFIIRKAAGASTQPWAYDTNL